MKVTIYGLPSTLGQLQTKGVKSNDQWCIFFVRARSFLEKPNSYSWACVQKLILQRQVIRCKTTSPIWMAINRARYYQVVCSLLIRSTLACRWGSHTRSCIVERNRPTPVRRRLSLTQAGLGKCIPDGREPTSAMKPWSREALSCHSMFHLRSAQLPVALVLKASPSFIKSRAAGTKGRLDLSYPCPP